MFQMISVQETNLYNFGIYTGLFSKPIYSFRYIVNYILL